MFVSQGCRNKIPQIGCLEAMEIYFLIIVEAEIEASAGWFFLEPLRKDPFRSLLFWLLVVDGNQHRWLIDTLL